MKGVLNQKPSLPHFTKTWDVRIMLQYDGYNMVNPFPNDKF